MAMCPCVLIRSINIPLITAYDGHFGLQISVILIGTCYQNPITNPASARNLKKKNQRGKT
jgi:hypothetical protein